MLNTSKIFMSSLSSLIKAIFITVCHVDLSRFTGNVSVFGGKPTVNLSSQSVTVNGLKWPD